MAETIQKSEVSKKLQSIYLTAAFILFVLAVVFGIFSGVAQGKDRATYENVETLNNALQYYFSDQDRYPTAAQFNDQLILLPLYMSAMPEPKNASGLCEDYKKFEYAQKNSKSFELKFCLRKGTKGLSKGSHVLTEKGLK